MKNYFILFIVLLMLGSCQFEDQDAKTRDFIQTETEVEKDNRMQWWRDAGFGLFIHWGLYAVPAGQYGEETNHAEWIQETANIPVEEYAKYALEFNPIKFDAEAWVDLAKAAGMKYIVITSKHHDGFCLWDSKVSDFDIMDQSPYQKDILKELSVACQKQGIVLCFYHSIMDWHHTDAQGVNHPDYNYGTGPNPHFHHYVDDYMKPQLKELLTNYGDIGVLWFDGEWIKEWTEEQGKELYNELRNIQPNIIINNRVGKGRQGMEGMNAYEDAAGDFGTPEQEILDASSELDWESCMTMNDHWGFNKFDSNFKSTETLIHNLIDINAKGGNFLLNVGPTMEGLIPDESILRLKEMGAWMDVNGEIIHHSRGTKHYQESESVYYIQSVDTEYLYAVFTQWPGKSVVLKYAEPLEDSEIELLGYDQKLQWEITESDGIKIELPQEWQDEESRPIKYAWVMKMQGEQAQVLNPPSIFLEDMLLDQKALFNEDILVNIKSDHDGAHIYYTTDGSHPTDQSKLYQEAIPISNSTQIKAVLWKEGYVNSLVSHVSFIKPKAFKSIEFDHGYSSKYGASGPLSLGDGEFGSKENYKENWLGFEGVDMVAKIDLGKVRKVNAVTASFLLDEKSWIFLPEYVELSVSENGVLYHQVSDFTNIQDPSLNGMALQMIKLNVPDLDTRYLKLRAKNIEYCPKGHPGAGSKAWLFSDEIIVE